MYYDLKRNVFISSRENNHHFILYIYFFNEVKVKINFRLRKIHSCILKIKDVKIGEIDKFNFDTIVKL